MRTNLSSQISLNRVSPKYYKPENAVGIQHEYQVSLETIRASSSWRLTAPLRRLLTLLRGH